MGHVSFDNLNPDRSHPTLPGPTPFSTLAEFITLVHDIKILTREPGQSFISDYNTLVEIRELIIKFEGNH